MDEPQEHLRNPWCVKEASHKMGNRECTVSLI